MPRRKEEQKEGKGKEEVMEEIARNKSKQDKKKEKE